MEEQKIEPHPKELEHHKPVEYTQNVKSKTPLILGVLLIGLLLIVGIAFGANMILTKNGGKLNLGNIKNLTNSGVAKTDSLRARRTIVDPATDSSIQVYEDNKMVVRLDIPKGAVAKKTTVTLAPYKDAKNNLQVQVSPLNLVFTVPVSLTFDFSRSGIHSDAPKSVGMKLRATGKTQVVLVAKDFSVPTLVARSTETDTALTGRILTGGTYKLVIDGKSTDDAVKSLALQKANSLVVLEAGSTLVYNNKTLTSAQKKRIKTVADKIAGLANPSPIELLPALLLQKKTLATNPFVRQAYAADMNAQYLEFRCKDRSLSVEEYVYEAQTAQAFGLEDIGQKCLDAAKAKVADQARALLGASNPSVSDLIHMMGLTQMFGLDDLDNALQSKLNTTVDNKVNDVLKDPNASLDDVLRALQDAQVSGQTGKEDALTQKVNDIATKEIDAVLNNPNSTSTDIALATQKAQALGLEGKSNEGIEKLKQMSTRTSEQILNNPNSTAKELQDALAQAVTEGKDTAYKNDIRNRIKDAQNKEAHPTPTPAPSDPEDLPVGFDPSIMGVAFLQMFGLKSFDEQGIKSFVQEKTDQSNELIGMMPEVCAMMRENGMSTPEMEEKCQYFEGGQASQDVQQAHDDGFNAAEQVGDTQSDDWQSPDEEPHMEIDITPTDDPAQYDDSSNSDSQDNSSDVNYTDDSSDNQDGN